MSEEDRHLLNELMRKTILGIPISQDEHDGFLSLIMAYENEQREARKQ